MLYLDSQRKRVETDARGNSTTFEMDERQRVVKITDADNKVQLFEYDGVNKTVEIDKRGHRTEFRYDRINRFTEHEDALGQTIATDYHDAARQVVETDKKRFVNTTQLDALGRLISVTRSGIRLEQHTYDGNSNRTLSTDANGNQTRFLYDGANRLTERIDGLASTEQTRTTFLYDDVGNLLEEKDGRDTGVAFDIRNAYDKLNRLETTTDAEGNTTSFEYDAEGNRTAVIEPKSDTHRTEFDYGELNELIEVRMPDGGVYNYTYDGNRNRIGQEDGESNVVTFSYDRLNRVDLMIQDPGGFNYITIHEYDANGNEIQLTDPKRQVIHFTYDELNRLDQKTYALTADDLALLTRTHEITYHYDPNDNLERVDELKSSGTASPAIVSNFKTYDTLDRLTSETDAWGRTLTYDYDPQGNRKSLTDPDSVQTEYTFDALNRLETLTLEARTPNAQTVVYEYFPDSLKKAVTNPNGTSSTYSYDDADRMETITHDGPGGVVSAYVYEYDQNGNRSQQIETNAGRTETTTYDDDRVNRLTVATYEVGTANATQTSYVYDLVGNRLTEQEVLLDTSTVTKDLVYAYDAINRLDTIDDVLGTDDVVYAYDPNGNTTEKTKAGLTTTFHYDIRDQLSEAQQDASILGRYGYDYNRRRILKLGDDGVRRYSYDQLSVVTEADVANTTVSKYDYGLDQLVSLDSVIEGRSFFHLDILRSTVGLTDDVGGSRQSILYDAWGNERDRVGASANKFTFTGHEKDEETGLIYAKARFYDPDIGRFLTQDSFLGDVTKVPSLHRYQYANANPLAFFDPTGNQSREVSSFEEFGKFIEEEGNFGTSFLGNFAGQFGAGLLQLPSKFKKGLFRLLTPSGLELNIDETVESPTRQKQLAAFREAADPENSFVRRVALGATGVLSQPVVIVEEALIIPVLEVPVLAGNVGREISKAIDADNDVDRAVHIATATRDFSAAFGTLLGIGTAVQQGIAGATARTQFRNLKPESGRSFFDTPGPAPRGNAIEGALAKNAPNSVATPRTFPVVDRVDPGGVVTSVKSIDVTLPSARNLSGLGSKLRGLRKQSGRFSGRDSRGLYNKAAGHSRAERGSGYSEREGIGATAGDVARGC